MKTWFTLLTASLISISMAHANTQNLEKNLAKNFPQLTIKSVHSTPLPTIYEVFTDERIVYTNEQAKYFLVGNLIDLAEQKNLTEQREQVLKSIDVSKLPLNQAIKHVKGKGEHKLYIFTDPDCPYCHRLEAELAKLDNVTLYTFMFPIVSLHPNASKISKQVWCSKDPYTAWTDYTLNKKQPNAADHCDNPVEKNIALAQSLGVTSTPTIFLENGNRISGTREAANLEQLMKEAKLKVAQ